MSAAELRTPFVLEAPVDKPDGAGGVRRAWAALGTIWGRMNAGSARETVAGEAGVSAVVYRVRLRATPPGSASRPTARHRLRQGARVFRVLAVHEDDPSGKYLEARVVEEITA